MRLRCARCLQERVDTFLQSYFLCDRCTGQLTNEAFHEIEPAFRDFEVQSYCCLCNELRTVKLTQWYLCPYCGRVVGSYRLGRVSQEFALEQWRRVVEPDAPNLKLEPMDVVVLSPHRRSREKRQLATELDCQLRRDSVPLAWCELKTGQRAPDDMDAFQLDTSDCDDILNVVATTGLPAYVLHVRQNREYRPPSDRALALGIWWADIYVMAANFLKTGRRRRNGGKMAALFNPQCFEPLSTLGQALQAGHLDALATRLQEVGPPTLYRDDGAEHA